MTASKIASSIVNILPWILTAALAVVLALGDGRYAKAAEYVRLGTKVEVMGRDLDQTTVRVTANETAIRSHASEYIPRRELEAMFQSIRESLAAQGAWNERYDKKLDLIAERLIIRE